MRGRCQLDRWRSKNLFFFTFKEGNKIRFVFLYYFFVVGFASDSLKYTQHNKICTTKVPICWGCCFQHHSLTYKGKHTPLNIRNDITNLNWKFIFMKLHSIFVGFFFSRSKGTFCRSKGIMSVFHLPNK